MGLEQTETMLILHLYADIITASYSTIQTNLESHNVVSKVIKIHNKVVMQYQKCLKKKMFITSITESNERCKC